MTRSVLAICAVAAVLLLAVSADAAVPFAAPSQAAQPLAISNVTPADGAFVPPTPTGGVPWRISAAGLPADASVLVTITQDPATGPDGTLLDANRVDFFFLSPDATLAGVYNGRSDPGPNAWSANLGTYYWQVRATWTDAAGVFRSTASDIQRLVIGSPPPPGAAPAPGGPSSRRATLAMSSLDAKFYVRTAIRRHTKRRPQRLHFGCVKRTTRSFRCRPSWRDSRNIYSSGSVTFTHSRSSGQRVVARGTFTGRRSSRQCVRRRSVRRCGVRFRWHTVTAARPIPSAARAAR